MLVCSCIGLAKEAEKRVAADVAFDEVGADVCVVKKNCDYGFDSVVDAEGEKNEENLVTVNVAHKFGCQGKFVDIEDQVDASADDEDVDDRVVDESEEH